MKVVSDTSIIINLARIDHLFLLPSIFTSISIPQAVFNEIVDSNDALPGSADIKETSWVKVEQCQNQSLV